MSGYFKALLAFQEFYSQAAYMFLLVTGLPVVILLATSWQLVNRRIKAKS
ncbi:reductive dehalogenase anchoring protein [Dehalococcoides mccartyi GY50]|nr:reductive dehalogenase anchoring protein [Dehalococcoides mccartyi GY50]